MTVVLHSGIRWQESRVVNTGLHALWDQVGSTLEPSGEYFGTKCGVLWDQVGSTLEPSGEHFGTKWGVL